VRQGIPVGKPYAPPPKKSGGWLLKGLVFVVVMGLCMAIGAFLVPKLGLRAARQETNGPVVAANPPADSSHGKTLAQLAAEEADRAQEQAEMEMAAKGGAEYTGVTIAEKLDEYKVVVPDAPQETKPVSRPAQEPVVVPELPMNSGASEVAQAADKEIQRKLTEGKVPASPLADDAEFLRRIYLDLTGKIPTYEQAVKFLGNKDPYKRAKLIDEILASEAYGHHMANVWTDLLIKHDFDNNKNL